MIPVFTACSLLSVAFNDAALYIKPIDDLYEAFALASFFLLLCAFVEENDVERQAFSQHLVPRSILWYASSSSSSSDC